MATVADFAPLVLPEVTGCPVIVANSKVLEAAAEFCAKSLYWRKTLAAVNAVAGNSVYVLAAPDANSVIVEMLAVRHNGVLLERMIEQSLDESNSSWRSDTSDQARGFTSDEIGSIRLWPTPNVSAVGVIEVRVALKPSAVATTLPQSLFNHYSFAIAAGAKATLMAMAGVTWANPALSGFYRSQFDEKASEAMLAAVKGFNRTALRTTMQKL